MRHQDNPIYMILVILILIMFLYYGFAGIVFEFRHQKANRTVLITHIWDVLTFSSVKEYQ
jgi:hypothetical protein